MIQNINSSNEGSDNINGLPNNNQIEQEENKEEIKEESAVPIPNLAQAYEEEKQGIEGPHSH